MMRDKYAAVEKELFDDALKGYKLVTDPDVKSPTKKGKGKKKKKVEEPVEQIEEEEEQVWKPWVFKTNSHMEENTTMIALEMYIDDIQHSPFPPKLIYRPSDKVLRALVRSYKKKD